MWAEKEHPRDENGRFTKKELQDMSAEELKAYILTGAINGAYTNKNDPNNKKREAFAKKW